MLSDEEKAVEKARYFRTKQYYRMRKSYWATKQQVSLRLNPGLWTAFKHFHPKKRSELVEQFVIDQVLYAAVNKAEVDGLDFEDEVRLREAGLWEVVQTSTRDDQLALLQEQLAAKDSEIAALQERLSRYHVFDTRADMRRKQ